MATDSGERTDYMHKSGKSKRAGPTDSRERAWDSSKRLKSSNGNASFKQVSVEEDVSDNGDNAYGQDTLDQTIDPEEEDDRFFGGGLTEEQTQALDYLDANDAEDFGPAVALDSNGLRKLTTRFQKAVDKNQAMRARYSDEPLKFLDSEVELNQEVKGLSVVSEYPELYSEFVDSGCLALLVSLFGHENSDIVCSTIQVLDELTEEDASITDEQAEELLKGLKSTSAIETLISTLSRLDESVVGEDEAVFKSISILESVTNLDENLAEELHKSTKICDWLLDRLKRPDEVGFPMSQNRQYAAELLSVFTNSSTSLIIELVDLDAVDTLLMLLAPYRRQDPDKGSIEEEFLNNLFHILHRLLSQGSGKDKFIEGEGVELMQRLLVDARSSETRLRALQTLEYACHSWLGGAVCQRVVEAGLLSNLFSLFMKKEEPEFLKTCLDIFVSFFRTLNDGEAERIRVINKFLEKDCAKTARLLDIRHTYHVKHDAYRTQMAENRKDRNIDINAEDISQAALDYLDRIDHGLDILQLADVLLAWLIGTDPVIEPFLRSNPRYDPASTRVVLQELIDNTPKEFEETDNAIMLQAIAEERQEREILEALLEIVPTE